MAEKKISIEAEKPKFVVDLDKWTMREFSQFSKAVQDVDYDRMLPLLAMVIVSWPYSIAPDDPDAMLNLTPGQFSKVMNAVNMIMGDTFSQGN